MRKSKWPKSGRIKPNGKPCGTFVISIDDGYVEYSFDMSISPTQSINTIAQRIRRAFRAKKTSLVKRIPLPAKAR